jgi:hypothetical protein
LKGIDGVKLEVVRVGASLCTSKQALERFYAAVTALDRRLNPIAEVLENTDVRTADELRREGLLD